MADACCESKAAARQNGGALVLTLSLVSLVFLAFLALIGYGFVMANRIHAQNVANLAALGAVAGLMSEPDSTARLQAAVDGANRVLRQNRLKGLGQSFGEIDASVNGTAWGRVSLGVYFPEDPGTTPSPCSSYPCFHEDTAHPEAATAVRVALIAPGTVINPWGGSSPRQIATTSYAGVVPRCIAAALDMSISMTAENYRAQPGPDFGTNANPDRPCDTCPRTEYTLDRAMFVYQAYDAVNQDTGQPIRQADCWNNDDTPTSVFQGQDLADADIPYRDERKIWCLMRGDERGEDTDPNHHYRDDYVYVNSAGNWGPVYVDTHGVAQPWFDVMAALNAAVRQAEQQFTDSDLFSIIGFDTRVYSRIPWYNPNTNSTRLSNNLDLFAQVTNPANRLPTAIHPNFLDRRITLFPRRRILGQTNLIAALQEVTRTLGNPVFGCPAFAQRIGILATDGLLSCTADNHCFSGNSEAAYNKFRAARWDLLASDIYTYSDAHEIQWIVLHLGEGYVDPHIKNVQDPFWDGTTHPGQFLMPRRAGLLGYRTYLHPQSGNPNAADVARANYQLTRPNTPAFVDLTESLTAFQQKGGLDADNNPIYFHGTGGYLFDLAHNGVYCPLNTPAASENYSSTLDAEGRRRLSDAARTAGAVEGRGLYLETKQRQAANCVLSLIRDVPFTLFPPAVEEN